jgi:hypothetical protein
MHDHDGLLIMFVKCCLYCKNGTLQVEMTKMILLITVRFVHIRLTRHVSLRWNSNSKLCSLMEKNEHI